MNTPSPLEAIFFAALEKSARGERTAYLDEACAGDAELRGQVERMLAAQADADGFLESPAGDVNATMDQTVTEVPGTRIGPYKLLQQIGEGGMGVVYVAEQTRPVERRVAIKITKPGMDTKQVIARFEAERQALAMMDHPNIAKVLDAGATESGRPYFVMELVHGIPITEYCDQHHLNTKDRLQLFASILHAVQHAHQKGIIHRDLKPTNVLVADYDDRPVPMVIDFGVAKATGQKLTEKTLFTHYGQLIGTLDYMSPEQAKLNQLDIDTRSDIYSLGVLLYELLTGNTPFDKERLRSAAFDEILRIIREEEPPRPSIRLSAADTRAKVAADRKAEPKQLAKLVHGELDWIVMKALSKDRAGRYETAASFADDIERYLSGEAVVACPPTLAYRLRKFTHRNKAALAGVIVLALVALGSTITAVKFHRLANEKKVALEKLAAMGIYWYNFEAPGPPQDTLFGVYTQDSRGSRRFHGSIVQSKGKPVKGWLIFDSSNDQTIRYTIATDEGSYSFDFPSPRITMKRRARPDEAWEVDMVYTPVGSTVSPGDAVIRFSPTHTYRQDNGPVAGDVIVSFGAVRSRTFPPSEGDFVHNTGDRVTARAWSISFDVMDPLGGSAGSEFDGGLHSNRERTDARLKLNMGDDVTVLLEKVPGRPITFHMNDRMYGTLELGDHVSIDKERNVKVNDTARQSEGAGS